jgi:hypothetical protein
VLRCGGAKCLRVEFGERREAVEEAQGVGDTIGGSGPRKRVRRVRRSWDASSLEGHVDRGVVRTPRVGGGIAVPPSPVAWRENRWGMHPTVSESLPGRRP